MAIGLHEFYSSFCDFKQKLIERTLLKDKSDDYRALAMDQLIRPVIALLCLCGAATIIFIAEILLFKWKRFRNRRMTAPQSTNFI